MVALWWCCINAGPTRQSTGRCRDRRGGGERAEGRKDSEEPRQTGEFLYSGENQELQEKLLLVPLLHSTLGFRQRFVA